MTEFSWLSHPLRVSVNSRIYNKNELQDVEAFVHGWENQELSITDLSEWVHQGFAYCAELKGYRNEKHFRACGVLSVDIDDGMTWEQALKHPLVQSSASLLYTSVNHTEEHHKFRIVFALERPIEDAKSMSLAMRSLALRLQGDSSATDASRLFYGSDGCRVAVFDRGLSDQQIEELIDQGVNASSSKTVTQLQQGGTGRSPLNIPLGQIIKTAKGAEQPIEQLTVSTPVFCPFHRDQNPSAFVTESYRGDKGIHCSKCGTTFWTKPFNDGVDFFAFDKMVRAIHENANPPGCESFFNPEMYMRAGVAFLNSKYIGIIPDEPGATFIKSPKGSGKTEFLSGLINENKHKNILLIGHRRSLIRQMCNRLDLNCYLDDDTGENDGVSPVQRQKRYGICLDSLNKVSSDMRYDYVLIDESEQVLSHFLSETLDGKRQHVFQKLKQILKTSKHLYALDADLDFVSLHFLSKWFRGNDHDLKSRIFINEYVEDRGALEVYWSKARLVGEIFRAIRADQKCYITSNSKNFISEQLLALKKEFPKEKFIAISSDTVGKAGSGTSEFLDNPAEMAKKYDAVLASPSVSTGVDITFPDNEQYFDIVFGVFEPLILTHFECDQQLSRVRNPKATKVYISPRTYFYESNFDVVMLDTLSMSMMDHLLEGYDEDGKPRYRTDDELLQLACALFSYRRKSINRLSYNFREYKKALGWTVEYASGDNELGEEGALQLSLGYNLSEDERIKRLLMSEKPTDDQFMALQEKVDGETRLSDDEFVQYQRGALERFYNQEISKELIKTDNKGKLRNAVRRFEAITEPLALKVIQDVIDRETEQTNEPVYLYKNIQHEISFIQRALIAAGLLNSQGFVVEKQVSKDDLVEFVGFIKTNRLEYETIHGKTIRKDLRKKPTLTLNVVLRMIGLGMKSLKKTRKGNRTTYFYKLDDRKLAVMQNIRSGRALGDN